MDDIQDDFIVICDEDLLTTEYNSKNKEDYENDLSLDEKHWNNKNIRKSLKKWRSIGNYNLLLEIAINYRNKNQYRKALKYWQNYFKKFSILDNKLNNDNIKNNSLNQIIIGNGIQNINNTKKDESKLIQKNNCIDDCIDLIFENCISPIKDFFNQVNNYCTPKISELYNNFINSFKNN